MMNRQPKKIVVLPGDGIGIEVTAQSMRVLDWFKTRRGLSATIEEHPYGARAYHQQGAMLPATTEAAINAADAILFGAGGGPETDAVPKAARRLGSLLH